MNNNKHQQNGENEGKSSRKGAAALNNLQDRQANHVLDDLPNRPIKGLLIKENNYTIYESIYGWRRGNDSEKTRARIANDWHFF